MGAMYITRNSAFLGYQLALKLHNLQNVLNLVSRISTKNFDVIDALTTEIVKRDHRKWSVKIATEISSLALSKLAVKSFIENNLIVSHNKETTLNLDEINIDDIEKLILDAIKTNNLKNLANVVSKLEESKKTIPEPILRKLFITFSNQGRPDKVQQLQNYCETADKITFRRNGNFMHYLAKAECFRGNSDKGLSLLKTTYKKFEHLRGLYRVIFKELIQDAVCNRSEASLVVFRKYVSEFSSEFNEEYPLICFWHCCWLSNWYSDQSLADELVNKHEQLRNIVTNRATVFSMTALRYEYNDDAVVRLLQMLIRFKNMTTYKKVLEILFEYRLRNQDLRGCKEIMKNCKTLGLELSSQHQSRYLLMLINTTSEKPSEPKKRHPKTVEDFKLKF